MSYQFEYDFYDFGDDDDIFPQFHQDLEQDCFGYYWRKREESCWPT